MDYAATYSNTVVRHYVSCMILFIDSDATYLVLLNGKSRIARYHYLLSALLRLDQALTLNAPMLVACKTL